MSGTSKDYFNLGVFMKDANHHIRHVQKKIIQETRKEAFINHEKMILQNVSANTLETKNTVPEASALPKKKHPRHIPAPPRIKSPAFH